MLRYVDKIPDDWPVEWLREMDETVMQPDGSNDVRRMRVMMAQRGPDEYVEKRDMGPTAGQKHEPLVVWAAGLTPAGRVRDLADQARDGVTLAQRAGLEIPDISRLFFEQAETRYKLAHHISTFGAHVRQVR